MSRDDDNVVGYRRPPKSGQFQKGKSGNPRGRPRKSENVEVSTAMAKVLRQRVTMQMQGRAKRVTIGEAAAFQLVEKASRGSLGALRDINAAQRQLEREEAAKGITGPTGVEYQMWLRTIGTASDVVELLMFLGVLYLSEDGNIHIERKTMLYLMGEVGLEFGDDPILYRVPLATKEIEAKGKTWRRDEPLFEQYMRLVMTSIALQKEASGEE